MTKSTFNFNVFILPFLKTFPFSGYNPATDEVYGKKGLKRAFKLSQKSIITDENERIALNQFNARVTQPFRMALSFLGIPNRIRTSDLELISSCDPDTDSPVHSFKNNIYKNTLKNYIDWPDKTPSNAKELAFHIAKAVALFTWNTITFLPKLAVNILKLATEYVPYVLSELCNEAAKKCEAIFNETKSTPVKLLAGAGIALASIGYGIFGGIRLVGRAITSPIFSMRSAYEYGASHFKNKNGTPSILGRVIGVALAAVSMAVTIAAYIVLFPLAIKAVAVVAPQIAVAIVPVVSKIAPFMNSVGTAIHAGVAAVFNALSVTAAHTGFAFFASAAITTVGQSIYSLIHVIKSKWHRKPVNTESVKKQPKKNTHKGSSNLNIDAYLQENNAVANPAVPESNLDKPSIVLTGSYKNEIGVFKKKTVVPLIVSKSAPDSSNLIRSI